MWVCLAGENRESERMPELQEQILEGGTMKKNTMLSLDEEIVEEAKKMQINLSQLCESAIRMELMRRLKLKKMFKGG